MIRIAALAAALMMTSAWAQDPAPVPEAPAPVPAVKKIVAKKIILVGDSTTQVLSGWGGSFCAHHVTSFVACVNLARGGRSSSSYRAEGSWDLALAEMKAPGFSKVYVLIQFGHNDQPGKPGRSTDLATEFPANIARYVTEAREAGAIPILLTPLTRRAFKEGQLADNLQPWADATAKVAAEMDVPLLDLHARSMEAVQAMGPEASTRLAEAPPSEEVLAAAKSGTTISSNQPNQDLPLTPVKPKPPLTQEEINARAEPLGDPKQAFDYTHLGRAGADYFSLIVTRELARLMPELRKDLIP